MPLLLQPLSCLGCVVFVNDQPSSCSLREEGNRCIPTILGNIARSAGRCPSSVRFSLSLSLSLSLVCRVTSRLVIKLLSWDDTALVYATLSTPFRDQYLPRIFILLARPRVRLLDLQRSTPNHISSPLLSMFWTRLCHSATV